MIEQNEKFYRELRCGKCRRLLLLEYVFRGRLAIKCKCGEITRVEYKTPVKNIERIEAQDNESGEPIIKK